MMIKGAEVLVKSGKEKVNRNVMVKAASTIVDVAISVITQTVPIKTNTAMKILSSNSFYVHRWTMCFMVKTLV
jgi:hypothetical protein